MISNNHPPKKNIVHITAKNNPKPLRVFETIFLNVNPLSLNAITIKYIEKHVAIKKIGGGMNPNIIILY